MSEHRRPRLRWWKEVLYVLAFYAVYSSIRIRLEGSKGRAFGNARRIIDLEQAIGTYVEEGVQQAFLGWRSFIQFWNVFYGSFHFIVTIVALVYMFRKMPTRYPLWRNTLACMTGLALVGFATFPLMPPRLLPTSYGFVDTLVHYPALWSFDSGAMKKAANQYAAMPSLHIGWATWCVCVLLPAMRTTWAKVAMALYPVGTLFAIVVTANHYWIDALGGLTVLGLGHLLARVITRLTWGEPAPRSG
ncbi:MAG TPA: phosphatase PAP2 family protein [Acidimicrobiales bacterium]|nr:phosphatase PAP2 family protein [Acidimicrobiales bacterium]